MKKIVFGMVTFLMLGSSACIAETSQETKKEVAQHVQTNDWQHSKQHAEFGNAESQKVQGDNEQEIASDRCHKKVEINKNEVTFSVQTLHF